MSVIETLRKRILKDTQFLLIPADTTKAIPELPYGTIKLISSMIRDGEGQGIEYIQDIQSKSYQVRDERYKQVLSFNIFAENEEAALNYAKTIHQWFIFLAEHSYKSSKLLC